MNAVGIPWRSYQEDLEYTSSASVSSTGTNAAVNVYNGSNYYVYIAKHNPMELFTDTQNTNVYPLAQFWVDLDNNAVGRYNWVTPDACNEMHNWLPNGFTLQRRVLLGGSSGHRPRGQLSFDHDPHDHGVPGIQG